MNWYLAVLKKYAVFEGRARRMEYWMFFLINMIVAVVLAMIDTAVGAGGVLYAIYVLAVFLPGLAVGVRRLHDTDRSGWWILLALIPFIGAIILIVLLVLDSTPGPNRFGPNPKEAAAPG